MLLIVFFAGFATAIYTMAPVPDNEGCQAGDGVAYSVLKSDDFAQKCSVSLHKCADVVKELGCKAGAFIKEKIEERRQDT